MRETGERHAASVAGLTRRGRVAVTALLLVLPAVCLVLALTSRPGSETAWLVIAGLNLVLPAVILPLVWRRDRPRRDASTTTAPEPALR